MRKDLQDLIETCRNKTMSKEDLEAQRVSFVYGNAPKDDKGTRQTVRTSLELAE